MGWVVALILLLVIGWYRISIKGLYRKIDAQGRLIRTLALNNEMLTEMNRNLKNIIYGRSGNKYTDPNNGGEGGGI